MSLAYFPMYPTDFDADTGHLSMAEDGAYNRLLRLSWRCPECKMPDDLDWICRKVRAVSEADRAIVQGILAEFFKRKGGKVFSARLQSEWVKATNAHEQRILRASKGGKAKSLKANESEPASSIAQECLSLHNQNQNQNHTVVTSVTTVPSVFSDEKTLMRVSRFSDFWNAYPHRDGKRGRKLAEAKYRAAVKRGVQEQTIIDGAKRAHTDPRVKAGYARDPTTWLNQAGWDDEIAPTVTAFRGGYTPEEQQTRQAAFEAMVAKARTQ